MRCMPIRCNHRLSVRLPRPTKRRLPFAGIVLNREPRAPGFVLLLALLFISAPISAHKKQDNAAPVVLAPGYQALNYDAPIAGEYQLPALGAAADSAYIDATGKPGQLHDLFDGRVTILSFIYTQCDDINGCPLASFVMSQVAKKLTADPQIREKLRLVSFSFDLQHDKPEVLAKYAKSFRPANTDWHFVVPPDEATLTTTLRAYQQSVQQSEGHAFAHILRVFLIDADKRLRNIYSTAFLHADTLMADIRTVLLEQGDLAPLSSSPAISQNSALTPATKLVSAALGLPPQLAYNNKPPTAAQIALGEKLFFDRRLSLNRTISCAMCHVPDQGFTVNELATAVGVEGRTVKRNAPSLLNVGYLTSLFHDAREFTLEHQVWSPLLARNEMANPSVGYVINNVRGLPGYRSQFEQAFGSEVTMESIGQALAAYQRSLIAGGSPFDRFFYGGDKSALSSTAQRGLALFQGKAGCSGCHTIGEQDALFTDEQLHNTGVGYLASMGKTTNLRPTELAAGEVIEFDLRYVRDSSERPPNDLGRYEVTQDPDDRWFYRTPGLRNIALSAPYMHNGSLSSLAEVIAFYNAGGISNPLLDPQIRPLGLNENEQTELLAFLQSLTSPYVPALVKRALDVDISNPVAATLDD